MEICLSSLHSELQSDYQFTMGWITLEYRWHKCTTTRPTFVMPMVTPECPITDSTSSNSNAHNRIWKKGDFPERHGLGKSFLNLLQLFLSSYVLTGSDWRVRCTLSVVRTNLRKSSVGVRTTWAGICNAWRRLLLRWENVSYGLRLDHGIELSRVIRSTIHHNIDNEEGC